MQRRLPWLLAASIFLAACQVQVVPPAKRSVTEPGTSVAGSTAPANDPATKPAQATKAPAKPNLLVPTEGAATLTGQVKIDPSYVVKRSAGKLIAPDGASLLAAGSAIISQDGAGLISQDGGGLVAQGGGNVVAPANLISQDGGGIISQDGGGLISQDGGGLISQDGGGLISQDGGGYALLAADQPGAGTLVPAAGMVVGVRSLETGKLLPLGSDAQGQPAYAVYTNMKGEYEVAVPPSDTNVEIVALVPGVDDARLRFGNLTTTATGAVDVNDDTTTVARYLFSATATFTDRLGQCKDEQEMAEVFHLGERPDPELYMTGVKALMLLFNGVNYRCLPRDKQLAVSYLLADRLLSKVPTVGVPPFTMMVATDNPIKRTETDAFVMLVNMFRERREAVTPLFDQKNAGAAILAFPTVQSVLKEGHRVGMVGAGDGYTFQRPADYGDFIARAIMGREFSDPTTVVKEVGGLDTDLAKHFGTVQIGADAEWFGAAYSGIGNVMLYRFVEFGTKKELAQEVAREALATAGGAATCP